MRGEKLKAQAPGTGGGGEGTTPVRPPLVISRKLGESRRYCVIKRKYIYTCIAHWSGCAKELSSKSHLG